MNQFETMNKTITLAQLAEAIANGHIQASRDDGYYTVRVSDVSRLARMLNDQPAPLPQRETYTESYPAVREYAMAS